MEFTTIQDAKVFVENSGVAEGFYEWGGKASSEGFADFLWRNYDCVNEHGYDKELTAYLRSVGEDPRDYDIEATDQTVEYEIFWDDQPGVEPGWCTRRTDREDGVIVSQDDEPLNADNERDVQAAREEAASHWGVDMSEIEILDDTPYDTQCRIR